MRAAREQAAGGRPSTAGPRGMQKGPRRALRIHMEKEKERGRRGGDPPRRPRARARLMRVERRPPVSGALLSHGLTPQYHRRSAA